MHRTSSGDAQNDRRRDNFYLGDLLIDVISLRAATRKLEFDNTPGLLSYQTTSNFVVANLASPSATTKHLAPEATEGFRGAGTPTLVSVVALQES